MVNLTYHRFFIIITLMLWVLPLISHAQQVYEGQVINAVTEEPLANATAALIKANTATASNNQGYYRLIVEKTLTTDTLVFSFVGYKTYRLPVSDYQNRMFIRLEPANNQLAQVNIGADKIKTLTIEKFSYADIKDLRGRNYYTTFPYYTIGLFAKQFEAPNADAKLTKIKLGRRASFDIPVDINDYPRTTSNKLARFLIHVMTADPVTGTPGKKIFTKEINLTDNSLLITVDVSKEHIIIPGKKFFIAIEWLSIPLNEVVNLDIGEKIKNIREVGEKATEDVSRYTIIYQPFLVIITHLSKVPAWTSKDGIKWDQIIQGSEIALSATITY